MRPENKYLVECSIHLLGADRVDGVGAGEHGGAVQGGGNRKLYDGTRAKTSLDVKKKS